VALITVISRIWSRKFNTLSPTLPSVKERARNNMCIISTQHVLGGRGSKLLNNFGVQHKINPYLVTRLYALAFRW